MICTTTTARKLMDRYLLNDIPILNNSFIDVPTVLNFLKNSPCLIKRHTNIQDVAKKAFIQISPKDNCRIRPYQKQVVNHTVGTNHIKPSMIVMPCGSGKTFTGLCCIATLQRKTLIITNYKIVANQWKNELLKYFDIPEESIQCIGNDSFEFKDDTAITIITYDTMSSTSTIKSCSIIRKILMTDFSLVILDEAHKAVASSYFNMLSYISGCFLAFTATPVREDSEMKRLKHFVSDEIEIDATNLIENGYLSKILCKTIIIPTHPLLFKDKYLTHTEKLIAAVINPNKIKLLKTLLQKLFDEKHRTLVFCDDIWSMQYVAKQIKKDFKIIGPICMQTTLQDREKYVRIFLQEDDEGKIMFISRTGDEGIDVPSATKLVQICTSWGSRRQHAQRVGRVQRPANNKLLCEAITLVSDNTMEVEFAEKRDNYLREMNYDVKKETIDTEDKNINVKKLVHLIKKRKVSKAEKKNKNKKKKEPSLKKKKK